VISRQTVVRALALTVIVLGATACFRGTIPARELFRLIPSDSASATDSGVAPPLGGSLAVLPYAAPGIYGQTSIVYRTDSVQYGAYPSREWALPLGVMLGDLTEHVLRARPLTREPAVYDPPSRREHSYVWRGRIREFDEVDGAGVVHAAVALDATLSRASDDSVLWIGGIQRSRVVPAPTMSAIVKALSDLSNEAVATLVDQAAAAVRSGPATVARPRR
jgi:uncharacterized lipoprotein YmbA